MKKAHAIIARSVGVIAGVTSVLIVLVALSAKFLVGFPWSVLADRLPFMFSVVVIIEAVGAVIVFSRLRVWVPYYDARDRGEAAAPEVFAKSLEVAYGFPAGAALNVFLFAFFASMILAVDLGLQVERNWISAFHILLPAMSVYLVAAVMVYYWLKLLYRPVLLDLMADDPKLLVGDFDRTYHFPLGPLLFIRRAVQWRLSLRQKLLISMSLLAFMGSMFLYVAYREVAVGGASYFASPEAAARLARLLLILLVAQVGISLAAALVLSYLAARDVSAPVQEIIRAARAVINGSYGERARVVTDDELGDVAAAVNLMSSDLVSGQEEKLVHLRETIRNAEDGADRVVKVSKGMMDGIGGLSAGVSGQLDEVAQANERAQGLGRAAEVIAHAARKIESVSNEALRSCEQGTVTVQEMVNTMDKLRQEIHGSSNEMKALLEQARKIRGVVELIDEISDQINLVSLNAALEAAGAGEAGRRFNAVAQEITRLAERTLSSTGQVNRMINDVIKAAESVARFSESGKAAVDQSVVSMEEVGVFLVILLEQVEDVTKQVLGITGSTEDQSRDAMNLSESLRGIEDTATRFEQHVIQVQNALAEMDNIARDLRGRVSEEIF